MWHCQSIFMHSDCHDQVITGYKGEYNGVFTQVTSKFVALIIIPRNTAFIMFMCRRICLYPQCCQVEFLEVLTSKLIKVFTLLNALQITSITVHHTALLERFPRDYRISPYPGNNASLKHFPGIALSGDTLTTDRGTLCGINKWAR